MPIAYSQYLWGFEVVDSGTPNNKLDFIDNGATYQATLTAGVYTPDELALHIRDAMRLANTENNNNNCTFSYTTLQFTLTGTATFTLKFGWSRPDSVDGYAVAAEIAVCS